jgi:hypothetical protein
MTTTDLIDAATEKANLVTEWRGNVARIQDQQAAAKAKIAALDETRRRLALDSALGERPATSGLDRARREQAEAEKTLEDLTFALERARDRLRDAELAHAAATREVTRARARKIVEERIKVSEKLDDLMRQADEALVEFERLGREVPDLDGGSIDMSVHEMRAGHHRLVGAIGPGLKRILDICGYHCGGHALLASGERLVWRSVL